MRCAEGSSITKLCMVVHSADPLLYLQEFHLPEHSREEGEALVKTNTVKEKGFHQLTDKVSLFFPFSSFSLFPQPLLSSPLALWGNEQLAQFADSNDIYTGKFRAVSLLLPPVWQLALIACKLHLHMCIRSATAAKRLAQRGAGVSCLSSAEPMKPEHHCLLPQSWRLLPTASWQLGQGSAALAGVQESPSIAVRQWPCRAAPASTPRTPQPAPKPGASTERSKLQLITIMKSNVFLLENDVLLETKLCA